MTTEQEILQIVERQTQSWNCADAAAYAQDCAEDIMFTNIRGETLYGKPAFEQKHVEIFASIFAGSRLSMTVTRLVFPMPQVALAHIYCRLAGFQSLPPGVAPQPDGCLHTRLLEVLVQSGLGWKVVAYHNIDVKPGVLK